MADIYYVKRGTKLFGPYTYDQVTKCIRKDIVGAEDLISRDKVTWLKIGEFLSELKEKSVAAAPAAVPQAEVSSPFRDRVIKLQTPSQSALPHVQNLNVAQQPFMTDNFSPYSSSNDIYSDFYFKQQLEGASQRTAWTFFASVIFACLMFLFSTLGLDLRSQTLLIFGGICAIIFFIVYLLFFIFGMISLYRSWKTLLPHEASTTPGKAVGFLFIPFFNLYWIFVAFYSFAADINKKSRMQGRMAPVNEGAILFDCILYLLLLIVSCVLSCIGEKITTNIANVLSVVNCLLFGACILYTAKAAVRFYNSQSLGAGSVSPGVVTPKISSAPAVYPQVNPVQQPYWNQGVPVSGNHAINVLVSQLSMYTNNIQMVGDDTVVVSGMAAGAFGTSLCNDQTMIKVFPVSNDFCNYVPQIKVSYSGVMIFWLVFCILFTGLIFLIIPCLIYHSCQNTIKNNINQAINNAMLQLRQH